MPVKLALPKGRLQRPTAALLQNASLGMPDYHEGSRSYRPQPPRSAGLFVKVFQEKDIAVQVAIGNYDLGICGRDWIEELLVKYPSDAVVKVRDLGYGWRSVIAAESALAESSFRDRENGAGVRIVSEYPNLAESFALQRRLRRFRVSPLWGAAEAYPPENAELVVVPELRPEQLEAKGLRPVSRLVEGGAFLIANKQSLEQKEFGSLLEALYRAEAGDGEEASLETEPARADGLPAPDPDAVFLALPDGHQQRHVADFLERIGVKARGYHRTTASRRPTVDLEGVRAKVIRPQDMPLQVASGNFDLAITGRDWLRDHLGRFPSSPVRELQPLGFGNVRVVAVVSEGLPAHSTEGLRALLREGKLPVLHLASEYVNIADSYARENHLAPCRLVPTWGASEAFLPEDADVLIENTETGATLARNRLRIIETLFESEGCLIGSAAEPESPRKRDRLARAVDALRAGG